MRIFLDYLKHEIKKNKVPYIILLVILISTLGSLVISIHNFHCLACWFVTFGFIIIIFLIIYQRYRSISWEEMNKSFAHRLKDDLGAFIVFSIIILLVLLYGITSKIPMIYMLFLISLIAFLILSAFTIRYGLINIKYYKIKKNRRKYIGSIIVVILILMGAVFAIYIEADYIFSPEGEQIYYIEITQNTSAEYEIILPNLVHRRKENVTLDPDEYKILNGEAKIERIDEGRFLKIESTSLNLTIQFKLETYFMHKRDLIWDYQWDLIKKYEGDRYMNITYNSSNNQECLLTLEWTDNMSPFFGGHWYSLQIEERLTDGVNKVYPNISKDIV